MSILKSALVMSALLLSCAAFVGCEEKGPLEKAGEKTDKAIDKTGDKVEEAADEVEDAVDDATDNR